MPLRQRGKRRSDGFFEAEKELRTETSLIDPGAVAVGLLDWGELLVGGAPRPRRSGRSRRVAASGRPWWRPSGRGEGAGHRDLVDPAAVAVVLFNPVKSKLKETSSIRPPSPSCYSRRLVRRRRGSRSTASSRRRSSLWTLLDATVVGRRRTAYPTVDVSPSIHPTVAKKLPTWLHRLPPFGAGFVL
jgi:hypothetical protein